MFFFFKLVRCTAQQTNQVGTVLRKVKYESQATFTVAGQAELNLEKEKQSDKEERKGKTGSRRGFHCIIAIMFVAC